MAKWEYIGDLRCPCCGRYSKVKSNGKGDKQVLKLECKSTGQLIAKEANGTWFAVNEEFDAKEYRRERKEYGKVIFA